MTIVYLSRHSQPFRKLLGEYQVNEKENKAHYLGFIFFIYFAKFIDYYKIMWYYTSVKH